MSTITIEEVLDGTDMAVRLLDDKLDRQRGDRFNRVPLSERSEADRIVNGARAFGLNVKPLDLTDPDGNYVNAFEQRMYHHERPLPPRPERPTRTGRPPRKPVSLGKPVPTMPVSGLTPGGSCRDASTYPKLAGVRGDEATDQQRRIALAAALNIDNINDLED